MNAAVIPTLTANAYVPVRILRVPGGIVANYSAAQVDRATVWRIIGEMFGQVRDVTPAVTQ